MQRKIVYTILIAILGACAFCLFPLANSGEGAYNWYCVRNSEHKTPELEQRFSFIEKYDAYFVGDSEDNVIYLTFDAGYENGNVEKILDVLKAHNAKGAFFILKQLINKNPDLVMRMENEGHTVCNHTMNHKDMTKFETIDEFRAELDGLNELYKNLVGKDMAKYYRPPEGKFSEQNLDFATKLGYSTVFWSFAYADWDNAKQPSAEYAKEKILSNVHNGEIMLLHPTSGTNAAILDEVLTVLENDGYRFGTLDELTGKI